MKAPIATILNNDPDGERVELFIIQDEDGSYYIGADSGEDAGAHFSTKEEVLEGIVMMWGAPNSPWDLQFN